VLILPEEKYIQQDLEILRSFEERIPNVNALAFAPVNSQLSLGNLKILPWESIV
jgi:hypothetical protein